jgi:hypothetical protein
VKLYRFNLQEHKDGCAECAGRGQNNCLACSGCINPLR